MDFMYVIAIFFVILGVVYLFRGISFMRLSAKLREQGKSATATVTDVSAKRIGGRKTGRYTAYYCTLKFTVGDKMKTAAWRTTKSKRVVGDTMEITYLPDNPDKFRTAEELADPAWDKAVLVPGIIWLALAVMFLFLQ